MRVKVATKNDDARNDLADAGPRPPQTPPGRGRHRPDLQWLEQGAQIPARESVPNIGIARGFPRRSQTIGSGIRGR